MSRTFKNRGGLSYESYSQALSAALYGLSNDFRCSGFALHLLKDENDHVEVHELRGFVADDLVSTLAEVQAISRGAKAKQPFFSLSLNPPPEENVSAIASIPD